MSAEHVRREYQTRLSIHTRAQNKSMNRRIEINDSLSQNDVSKGQKKRKRHLVADEDQVQKNDSTNNIKRIKKLHRSPKHTSHINDFNVTNQSPHDDKSRNKVVEKEQLSAKKAVKDASNSHSPKLKNSSFSNTPTQIPRRSKASRKLSKGSFLKLKSPEKLSLTLKSPIKRKKSNVSLDLSDAAESTRRNSSKLDTPGHSKITPVKKNKSKSATPSNKKQILRRFPKSPKIVLKSFSKLKSPSKKKLRLPKLQSPETKRFSNTSNTIPRINIVDVECNNNSENDSTGIDNKTANETMHEMTLKCLKNGYTLKEPVVVLQRLSINIPIARSLAPLLSPSGTVRASSTPINSLKSPEFKYKRGSPLKTNSSRRSSLGTPSKYNETPSDHSTPIDKSKIGKRNVKCETITAELQNTTQQETSIQVESNQEEVKVKNVTYELAEPQTPKLRNKLKAKQDKMNSKETKMRKSLKVRFTSNSPNTNCTHGFRLCTICDKKEQLETSDNTTIAAKLKLLTNGFHERLNSTGRGISTPVAKSFTPSSQFRRMSKFDTDTGSVATPSLNTPIKRPDRKNSATKKVPNFAEIHKRIFAKSESIVDAKRRIEKKHLTLITPNKSAIVRNKEDSKKEKRLSNESSKGLYNRFGFRIKKNDATNCILKKNNLQTMRSKDREQARTILKGVRTNRRFELQMKSRNLNY